MAPFGGATAGEYPLVSAFPPARLCCSSRLFRCPALSLQDRELHCCSHPTQALSLSVPVPVSRICSRESKIAAATIAHEKEKRKPKYIGNLLKQAKMRAVESDRIFDRKLQKEREEQDKVRRQAGRQAGGEGVFLPAACTYALLWQFSTASI